MRRGTNCIVVSERSNEMETILLKWMVLRCMLVEGGGGVEAKSGHFAFYQR